MNANATAVRNGHPGDGSGICVVAQILEWKDEIWSFWCGLAEALEKQGQSLLLLSPYAPPNGATWPRVLPIPYWFGQYAPSASVAIDRHWDRLLESDSLYRTFLPPTRAAGRAELASTRAFVTSLLDELDPDVVMSWAPPFPVSQLLLGETRRREIPAFGLELGFLPNTLMVESHDIGFGSDLISLPSVVSARSTHPPSPSRVKAMRDYYQTVYPATEDSVDPGRVVLLGSCPGFNLAPQVSRQIQLASPWIRSFSEAYDALRDVMPAGTRLLARPHPADVDGQHFCRTQLSSTEFVPAGSIRGVLESADVVAVIGGTRTQIDAVLLDKPVLLLSRSCLWGAGIAYESDGANLRTSLDAALTRSQWPQRSEAAHRYLSFLAQHCLYGYGGAPVDRGASDLAAFLRRFRLPGAATETPSRRLERFIDATAPLLGPYVCSEVARGLRPMAEVYEPYVEAQIVAQVVQAGVLEATVCGAGVAGQRLARRIAAHGIRLTAILDSDPAFADISIEGLRVRDEKTIGEIRTTTVVASSHAGEHALRNRIRALARAEPPRIFGPGTVLAAGLQP